MLFQPGYKAEAKQHAAQVDASCTVCRSWAGFIKPVNQVDAKNQSLTTELQV